MAPTLAPLPSLSSASFPQFCLTSISELFDCSPTLTRHVTVGRTSLLWTADPQVVHHILKSHFLDYPKGPSFYPFFADLLGNGIFNCDGAIWRLQRKVASHVFTTKSLREFLVAIADAEIVHRLLPLLDSVRLSNGAVDLQALLMHYTFDTTCQLTFGSDPGCLDSSKLRRKHFHGSTVSTSEEALNHGGNLASHAVPMYAKVPDHLIEGFVEAFQVALKIIAERFLVPTVVWKLKRSFKVGSERRLINALEVVSKFTSFAIEQSKRDLAGGKDRKDLLARFMLLSSNLEKVEFDIADDDEQEGLNLSDAFLKNILLSFILAGRDAVASGITFTLWLISIHPRVERSVLKEISDILKRRELNGALEGSKGASFTYDEVRKMDYLQAVISESMRLYPPVPLDVKYAARNDTFPDGTQVWEGCQVTYNVFAMGRAERLWGKDCLEFQPERWLDETGCLCPPVLSSTLCSKLAQGFAWERILLSFR